MQTTWHEVVFLAVEGVWLKGGNSTTITWLKEDAKCVREGERPWPETQSSPVTGDLWNTVQNSSKAARTRAKGSMKTYVLTHDLRYIDPPEPQSSLLKRKESVELALLEVLCLFWWAFHGSDPFPFCKEESPSELDFSLPSPQGSTSLDVPTEQSHQVPC